MKKVRPILFTSWIAGVLTSALTALAQVPGPAGHYYQVVIEPNLTWSDCRVRAEESTFNGVHGHLATITSAEEDQLIENLRREAAPAGYGSLWVGGYQEPDAIIATEGWYWVNGEGPIPTRNDGVGYSDWQAGEPNDYWGPQSEGFLSVGHFNNFGWNDEPDDRHIWGYVVEFPSGGMASVVKVAVIDSIATENGVGTDTATFEFTRDGDVSLDLPVFYSVHGSALNGADYNEISKSIIIPAGQPSVKLPIVPRPDPLAVVEPMETVGIRIEPSLILTPAAAYRIDLDHREAVAVIFENTPPGNTSVDIGVPRDGFVYKAGERVALIAAVFSPEPIATVDFYAGDVRLGAGSKVTVNGSLDYYEFNWGNPPIGPAVLTARATTDGGGQVTSSPIQIEVQGEDEIPRVGIRFAATTEPLPNADYAPGFLEVTRSGPTQANLEIFYAVTGTATADVDYERLQGYVVIGAGRTSARITVVAKDDSDDEPDETVIVTLVTPDVDGAPTSPSNYSIDPEQASAEAVIYDNHEPSLPLVGITAVTAQTWEPGPGPNTTPGLFRVFRSGPATQPLTVSPTYSGTAAADGDYRGLPATVTFAAGASEVDLSVEAFEDNAVEGAETIIATLAPVGGFYQVDPAHASGTVIIRDNEPGPRPSIVITAPQSLEHFRTGTTIQIDAIAIDPGAYILDVEFFAGENKIGESVLIIEPLPVGTPVAHHFQWRDVPAGMFHLSARAKLSDGRLVVSDPVPIQVGGGPNTPVIRISADPTRISETAPTLFTFPSRVTVYRTGSLALPQRVYLRYEGTATPGRDFSPAPPEILIPPGESFVEFLLSGSFDDLIEGTEQAIVHIGPPNFPLNPDPANRPYEIDSEARWASIDIFDSTQNGIPTVSLWQIVGATREFGPTEDGIPAVFAVRRTGPADKPLAVYLDYAGSASIGDDYANPGSVIEIPAGQSETRVSIFAKDDSLVEPDETVLVQFAKVPFPFPPPYLIDLDHESATLVIHDNDGALPPTVLVTTVDEEATEFPPEVDAVDPARFRVSRQGNLSGDLTVFFSIHGTALNGVDYQTIQQSVTIPTGQESVDIGIVPISGDGGTRHPYQVISAPGIHWEEARQQATAAVFDGVHGHLATITSAEEDAYIESLRQEAGGNIYWVGGYQQAGEISITEGWKWVNDEGSIPGVNDDRGYANWLPGEPNDYWGVASENQMVIGWLNSFGWNDQTENIGPQGYVVEFDTPVPGADEKLETVGIRLEASPTLGPRPPYLLNSLYRYAGAVIYERRPPAVPTLEVVIPGAGTAYQGEEVVFLVAGYHPDSAFEDVDFFVDGQRVGSTLPLFDRFEIGGLNFFKLTWASATAGHHVLQAKATLQDGTLTVSSEIPFVVEGVPNNVPIVTINQPADGSVFLKDQAIEIAASASDPDGTIQKLELLLGETVIASANNASLQYTWAGAPVGSHLLTARAVDDRGAVGISAAVHVLVRHPDTVAFVWRALPSSYSPGVPLVVELRAEPPDGADAYAVEDQPPAGWQVTNVSHDGLFDGTTGKVKFGPFTDATPRILAYTATPEIGASGRRAFTGESALNGALYPVAGDDRIDLVEEHHPADRDTDFTLRLGEMTAYAAAWKAGDTWPSGPVPIPLNYVTSAGSIWKRGEIYQFVPALGPAPDCWVPVNVLTDEQPLPPEPISVAARSFSGDFRSGAAVQVKIEIVPSPGATAYAVEEKVPRGWTVSDISHGGAFDPAGAAIRWGVFADSSPRSLTYSVTPPVEVAGFGAFAGLVSIDGQLARISPAESLAIDGATPIRIMNCRRDSNGVFLHIRGPADQTAVLEASADFRTWVELKSIFIPNGDVEITDDSAPATGLRFYRLRVQ